MGGSRSSVTEAEETACLEITRQVVFRNYKLRRFDTPQSDAPVSVRVEYQSHTKNSAEVAPCQR